jgi:hypothetical protein
VRFGVLLLLLGAAGCKMAAKPTGAYGQPGVWPDYACEGTKTAEWYLNDIFLRASQPPPDPYKELSQQEVLRVLALPDDPGKNPDRCTHVMRAWDHATKGNWQLCFWELHQCD